MSSQLCAVCIKIDPRFWSEELDDSGFPWGDRVRLQSYKSMERAAEKGCNLCQILLASADASFFPDQRTLENVNVYLSRATLDTHQAVCLAIGNDDISHTTFYRAPKPWSQSKPMKIDDCVDNSQMMKNWLQDCRQNHRKCSKNLKEFFLPTRLLDLQAFETGDDVRLVSTDLYSKHQNAHVEYITLSHCWGPPERRPITTIRENLRDRMQRISIGDLSNTFRDAVSITRNLGVRYLWIDSLCIIQNDHEDWAKEAALMADVYGNSYCTLAALSSKDSTGGCRIVPDLQAIGQFFEFDTGDNTYGPYRVRIFDGEPQDWHNAYRDDPFRHRDYGSLDTPLRTRAWTLQERELSRRNIHFGKDQLLWECAELKASAQLPWHEKKPEDDFVSWPIRNNLSESLAPNGTVALRERWYDLMEDYSSRSLTKETDKLPALSGLARHFQDSFQGEKYIAGIWSHHLPAALLWRNIDGIVNSSSSYISPTWSWSSAAGRISYESQRLENMGTRMVEDRPKEESWDCDFGDLKVEKIYSLPKYEDIYGAITNAHLFISGALLALVDSEPKRRGSEYILTKDGATVGVLHPDDLDELQYSGRLFCLRVRGESKSSQISQPSGLFGGETVEASILVMGLILEEDLEEYCYRRIGLARWVKRGIFEDSKLSRITLI